MLLEYFVDENRGGDTRASEARESGPGGSQVRSSVRSV